MSRAQTSARRAPSPQKGPSAWLAVLRERMDRDAANTPARIMAPRLALILAVAALLALGLVMVFSASSIKGLLSDGQDPSSFLTKQVMTTAMGLVIAVVVASVDYHAWAQRGVMFVWVAAMLVLLAVLALGMASHGATRWIQLGPVSIQPSEFAKTAVVVVAAKIIDDYVSHGRPPTLKDFALRALWMVGLPLGLILLQPDKGTTLVVGLVVFCLALMAGVPKKPLLVLGAVCVLGYFLLSVSTEYSRQRLLVMLDPFSDPNGAGYQLVQGFYAFGSGGLFGRGLGMGREKYSYLPEAHNDFIFAVIGEELGLAGCLLVLVLFAVILWAGFRIAKNAPDLLGSLVASGCTLLLVFGMLLNVCGVIGIFPMSGKAIPFVSYGGSAVMGSLLTVGAIMSVSLNSHLPETSHDRRRRGLAAVGAGSRGAAPRPVEGSTAGEAKPRSLRLVAGGQTDTDRPRERATERTQRPTGRGSRNGKSPDSNHPEARRTRDGSGRERIDLGPDAADRLRPNTGPQVRDRGGSSTHRPQRRR